MLQQHRMIERLRACTAPLDAAALRRAYAACWQWGGEIAESLRDRCGIDFPAALWRRIGSEIDRG